MGISFEKIVQADLSTVTAGSLSHEVPFYTDRILINYPKTVIDTQFKATARGIIIIIRLFT